MNIAEEYEKRKRLVEERKQKKLNERFEELIGKIRRALKDQETITAIENYLIRYGYVTLEDFGCLCQMDDCSWQAGLQTRLQDIIDDWNSKGVHIRLTTGMHFYLPQFSNRFHKMSIRNVKVWSRRQ